MLQYGVVIYAGSSHSQIFVYRWDGEKENGTAIARQIFSCKAKGKMLSKEPSGITTIRLSYCHRGFISCILILEPTNEVAGR